MSEPTPGRVLSPLVRVVRAEDVTVDGQPRRRLTLFCGHVVVRPAYMGGPYHRARCPECPPKETP